MDKKELLKQEGFDLFLQREARPATWAALH